MATAAQHLKILYLTEHAVDIYIPPDKPFLGVHNGLHMINLYISGDK
jgi:hypothetical protein